MNRFVILLLVSVPIVSVSAFFSPAHAGNDRTTYIGVQLGVLEADDGNLEFEADYGLFRIGIMPTENTALEYRIGTGRSADTVGGVTFELENVYGLYGLYHINFSENASIYGVAGFSKVSVKASSNNSSDQDDDQGFSLGIGAQVYGINVEYMQYLDTTDLDVRALAVGYNYKFN